MSLNIEKQISNSILRTIFASLFAIIIKCFQLGMYHDNKSGLLIQSPMSTFMGIIFLLCMLYVIVEYIMLTLKVEKIAGYVNLTTHPLIGLLIIVVGVCFIFQGIMDIITSLKTGKNTALSSTICVLTVASAISFFIQGFEIIGEKPKHHFFLNMIPVLWSIAILMNVIITYPIVASMQSNISKVICCSILVLFMYYIARWACGYEKSSAFASGVFFKISFSCLMLMFVLPYCIMYILGVKDSIRNIPYIAMLGLALYGFVILLQYMALCLDKIERKSKFK